jgi:catechol 2,3-dioxygenase-like lactoylglutathione lyase family enzyme
MVYSGMTTSTKTGLTGISLICVGSSDQDRSIAFYESLGFEKTSDVPFGGDYRWVEVHLPGTATGIALAPPRPGSELEPQDTGITLTTEHIDATYAAFKDAGVDVDAEVARMGDPVPPMFWFRDPDGHSLMVVETPGS